MANPIPLSVKSLGHHVAAYVLNLDVSEVERLFSGTFDLDPNRQGILDQYVNLVTRSNQQAVQNGRASPFIGSFLGRQVDKNGRHGFILYREHLGGDEPKFDNDNGLDSLMFRLAIDAYAMFLVDVSLPRHGFVQRRYSSVSGVCSYAVVKPVCQAIMEDADFVKMFPSPGKDEIDTACMAEDNFGNGSGIQLIQVPEMILVKAYELMRLNGKSSLDDYIVYVKKTLDMMRAVIRGETIQIPVFVGVQNVAFKEDFEVDTAYGALRTCSPGMKELLPERAVHINADGLALTVILETSCEYKVRFSNGSGARLERMAVSPWMNSINLVAENLSAAFVLGIENDMPIGVNSESVYLFKLFGWASDVRWNENLRFIAQPYAASHSDVLKVAEWCKLLHDTDDEKIRIAIRRVLSSVVTRLNYVDGFIDAMIALECLFGGHSEVTLRVSVAVAKLLYPSGPDRTKCKKAVSKLYGDRSTVVHGVKELDPKESQDKWRDAINIVLECLRKLYAKHPDLIPDTNRAVTLLLDEVVRENGPLKSPDEPSDS